MLWLLVERVEVLTCGAHVEAVCRPLGDEFPGHFPVRPMVPGAFGLEAMAQVGTILLETSDGFARKALPVMVDGARFRQPVDPSLPMRVAMSLHRRRDDVAMLGGVISQDGARCCTASFGFVLAPLSDFYDRDSLRDYRALFRGWLSGARLDGFPLCPLAVLDAAS